MRRMLAQFSQFGVVGLVGFGLDFVVFNVLRATVLEPEHREHGVLVGVNHGAFYATVISTVVAIIWNWLGNRHWTFRAERRQHWIREGVQFGVVSLGGLLIALACLAVERYVLGFTSVLADNIAKNVVGLALGTAFRFWLYRVWVFRGHEPSPPTGEIRTIDLATVMSQHEVSARPSARSRPGARTAPAADAPRRD